MGDTDVVRGPCKAHEQARRRQAVGGERSAADDDRGGAGEGGPAAGPPTDPRAAGGGYVVVYYGAIIGLIVGGVRKLIRGIAACFRERAPVIEIRTVSVDGDAYRRADSPSGPPPSRQVEPRPLA